MVVAVSDLAHGEQRHRSCGFRMVLFKHLQAKLLRSESKLKESQYQLTPWHSDVSCANIASQSQWNSHGAPLATSNYHPSRVLTLVYQPFAFGTLAILAYNEAKFNTRRQNLFGYSLFFVSTLVVLILDLATSGRRPVLHASRIHSDPDEAPSFDSEEKPDFTKMEAEGITRTR